MRLLHVSKTLGFSSKIIGPTGKSHSATVFFFHGAADSAPNLVEWVRDLLGRDMEFPHIKMVYPNAPNQPFSLNDGEVSRIWFDITTKDRTAPENRESLERIYGTVNNLLREEQGQGIAASRIIVGGFSMGGILAMHTAFHLNTNLAGAFACSSYLSPDSVVYESIKNHSGNLPELKMYHGTNDDVIAFEYGRNTFNKLKSMGVRGDFTEHSGAEHELTQSGLSDIQSWISRKLPPK